MGINKYLCIIAISSKICCQQYYFSFWPNGMISLWFSQSNKIYIQLYILFYYLPISYLVLYSLSLGMVSQLLPRHHSLDLTEDSDTGLNLPTQLPPSLSWSVPKWMNCPHLDLTVYLCPSCQPVALMSLCYSHDKSMICYQKCLIKSHILYSEHNLHP